MSTLRFAAPQQAGVAALWLLPVGLSVGIAGIAPAVVGVATLLVLVPFADGRDPSLLTRYVQWGVVAAVLGVCGPVAAFVGVIGMLGLLRARSWVLGLAAVATGGTVVAGTALLALGTSWNRLQPYWSEPGGWLLPSIAVGALAAFGLRPLARWPGAPWTAAGMAIVTMVGLASVAANAGGGVVSESMMAGVLVALSVPLAAAASNGAPPSIGGAVLAMAGTLLFLLGGTEVSAWWWGADLPILVAGLLAERAWTRRSPGWGLAGVGLLLGTLATLPGLPAHPAAASLAVLPLLGAAWLTLAGRGVK